MPELVSLGECMIELFSEEPMEVASTFQRSFAGDSYNILVAANRLGTTAGYITRLGSDPFASYLLKSWRDEGIDVSQVRQVDGFNAVHFVAQLPDGDREFVYYRKGSAPSTMEPSDLDPDYILSAKVFHASGIAQAISTNVRATVLRAAQIAHEGGVPVSYDPNYRHQLWTHKDAREGMEELLPYVTYMLLSEPSDTEALLGTSDPLRVVEALRARGVETVAVKRGANGAVIGVEGDVYSKCLRECEGRSLTPQEQATHSTADSCMAC